MAVSLGSDTLNAKRTATQQRRTKQLSEAYHIHEAQKANLWPCSCLLRSKHQRGPHQQWRALPARSSPQVQGDTWPLVSRLPIPGLCFLEGEPLASRLCSARTASPQSRKEVHLQKKQIEYELPQYEHIMADRHGPCHQSNTMSRHQSGLINNAVIPIRVYTKTFLHCSISNCDSFLTNAFQT